MTFLPIVARELRLASRRRGTYWLRSAAALGMLFIGVWVFLMFQRETPKTMAMVLFCILTGGAVLVALLSGPRSTADAISEEKREGTLGLLFLTDLKGYDVVLGKLVAGSLHAFYIVVALLPMLAIPLLLGGGITLAEFGRMALVIVNALFFSLTVSLWASSISRSAHKAAGLSLCVILIFSVMLPAFGQAIAAAHNRPRVSPLLLTPSPGFAFYLAFDAPYRVGGTWFWISNAVLHGTGWLALIVASLITPHTWQERRSSRWAAWRERWRTWTYGNSRQRFEFRQRTLELNPFLWLADRLRGRSALVWFFLALMGGFWVWGRWQYGREWLNEGVYVSMAIVANLALKYWVAAESSRPLLEQRKSGALELLLSTPLKVREILEGQWLSLRRQFLGPVLAVLAVECWFMIACAKAATPQAEQRFWMVFWLALMVMFIADFVALFSVGMWQGLIARNTARAVSSTVAKVLILPWIIYASVMLLLALAAISARSGGPEPGWKFFLGLWFALGIGTDLLFGLRSWGKLHTGFRVAAQQQYEQRANFWRRWFGPVPPLGPVVAVHPQAATGGERR